LEKIELGLVFLAIRFPSNEDRRMFQLVYMYKAITNQIVRMHNFHKLSSYVHILVLTLAIQMSFFAFRSNLSELSIFYPGNNMAKKVDEYK